MMKRLLILIALFLAACGQNSTLTLQNMQSQTTNHISGVFEYIYPYNTSDLIENHYISLSISAKGINGYYYGTSDEFDEAREGYLPAFFVSKMEDLTIEKDTIRFKLMVSNSDFLTQAVDLKYKTTNEALEAGYENWENKIPTSPKIYNGVIHDNETIIFKIDQNTRVFKKKK